MPVSRRKGIKRQCNRQPVQNPALHLRISTFTRALLFCLRRFDSGIFRGATPLHWSSEGGFLDVCQFLVEKGADVNATDTRYDAKPFTYAYEHLHVNVCFVCDVVILVFSEEKHRRICLLSHSKTRKHRNTSEIQSSETNHLCDTGQHIWIIA